ncbi:S-adenosyl-L-methionine-dependent methyltransferase [Fusarium sp. MPI-SDFR-AT-0072]|nr:S-adenosyl-L-methionine-dependent methyltransferase [Fusarium sp. MPI-SDFR-AT-0072]
MKLFNAFATALGLAGLAQAHMEMTYPPPFKSKYNPNAGQDIDYSMTSPLNGDGSNFPCKGYNSLFGTAAGAPTATWQAGKSYSISIAGGADHGGGSCQASLSFDRGKTWVVIQSWIGNCPKAPTSNFQFTLPVDTPAGEALFAWTWFNKIGNREMYMNCAAITVKAGSGTPKTPLKKRPAMFVANVGKGCGTTEMVDLMFPNPGPDVSLTSTNTGPPVGQCPAGPGVQYPSATPSPTKTTTTKKPTTTKPPVKSTVPGGVFITVPSTTKKTTLKSTTRKTTSTTTPVKPAPTKPAAGIITPGTACKPEGYWNCIKTGTAFQRCASGTCRYPIPNDDAEQNRDDMKHAMMLELTNGNLFFSPIVKNPQKIIDLATGTGIWAIDIADKFPSASVIGVDLSPIQPSWVPPNLKFLVDDIEDEWMHGGDFDFVHMRCISPWLKDEVKPGAWIEIQELDARANCDDGSLAPDAPLAKFFDTAEQAVASFGMKFRAGENLREPLEKAGFTNVSCKVLKVPIGTWAKDKKLRLIGLYLKTAVNDMFGAMAAKPLRKILEPEEIEVFLADARKDLNNVNIHSYEKYYFWMGQKAEE